MTDPVGGFRIAIRELDELGAQRFFSDYWTVSTATAMPGHPSSKLLTDLLSDYWQAYNHRRSNIWIQAVSPTLGDAILILRLISLLHINRQTPTIGSTFSLSTTENKARIIIDRYPIADRIRPAFTVTLLTNLTGSSSDLAGPIDPPDDPAPSGYTETKLTPINTAASTSFNGTWTNHYGTERTLTGDQVVRLHLSNVSNRDALPVMSAAIYQGGVLKKTMTPDSYEKISQTSSSGGFIINYRFNVTDLSSPSGDIELRVTTNTACDFIGLEGVFNLTGFVYDTQFATVNDDGFDSVGHRLDMILEDNTPFDDGVVYLYLEMSDFCWFRTTTYSYLGGGTKFATTYTSIINPGDPDGRFRAGRFIASDAAILPINGQNGWNLRTSTESSPARTRGGSFHGSRQSLEWLEADLSIIGISRVLRQKIERLCRTLGLLHNPTLLVPDPAMTEGHIDEQTQPRWMVLAGKEETHIGRVTFTPQDADSDGLPHTGDQWDLALRWIEHNGHKAGGGA